MHRILNTIWGFFLKDAQAKPLSDTSHYSQEQTNVSDYGMDKESLPTLKTDGNQDSLRQVSLL